MQSTRECSAVGCDRSCEAKGLCPFHYRRQHAKTYVRPVSKASCRVEACEAASFCKGMCAKHYQRVRSTGSPELLPRRGPSSHLWVGEAATYRTVHSRLAAERGKASNYKCVDCGSRAQEWSYDHADAEARNDSRCGDYSLDMAHYEPRCYACHRLFDH